MDLETRSPVESRGSCVPYRRLNRETSVKPLREHLWRAWRFLYATNSLLITFKEQIDQRGVRSTVLYGSKRFLKTQVCFDHSLHPLFSSPQEWNEVVKRLGLESRWSKTNAGRCLQSKIFFSFFWFTVQTPSDRGHFRSLHKQAYVFLCEWTRILLFSRPEIKNNKNHNTHLCKPPHILELERGSENKIKSGKTTTTTNRSHWYRLPHHYHHHHLYHLRH